MGKHVAKLLQEYVTAEPGRLQGGKSVSDLAVAVGVTREAASQWRSGGTAPAPSRLPAIADFCKISLDVLIDAYNADKGVNALPSAGNTIMTGEDAMQLQLLLAELRKNTKVQEQVRDLLAHHLGLPAADETPPARSAKGVNDNPPKPSKKAKK